MSETTPTGPTSGATQAVRTLVLLRHGKSDWDVPAADRDRPLAERGRRQAGEAGDWLARHGPALDLALVSTARRAMETWEVAGSRLGVPPPVRLRERAYTFEGSDLIALVGRLENETAVALVGHNPALEEAIGLLTGRVVTMSTSAIAVVELASWSPGDRAAARLVAHGRPPLA